MSIFPVGIRYSLQKPKNPYSLLVATLPWMLQSKVGPDPVYRSRLRQNSAFFFRTGSGTGVKNLGKTGPGVTFQFRK